jgi:hypothetical protein
MLPWMTYSPTVTVTVSLNGSEAAYRRAMIELGRRGWRTTEPAVLGAAEAPELIARALALVHARRRISVGDIALELALPLGDARALAAMAQATDAPERLSV